MRHFNGVYSLLLFLYFNALFDAVDKSVDKTYARALDVGQSVSKMTGTKNIK